MTFGATLRAARLGAGTTLAELAGAVGVSVAYLSDVELGRRGPMSPERVVAAARVLGVQKAVLLRAAVAGTRRAVLVVRTAQERDEAVAILARWYP